MDYSKLFLFSGINAEAIAKITADFPKPRQYKKGEIIYSSKAFKNSLGFIVTGKAIAVSNNNNHTYLQKFSENMCFGAAALFGGDDSYVSTITAKTDVTILFISEQHLQRLFLKYPQTAVNYIAFLSDKVRFLNTKLRVISSNGAEDTVLTYLLNITDQSGYAQIPENMTTLAKMLGLSRASLYRVLDSLEQNGSILRENNKYKVIKNEKTN